MDGLPGLNGPMGQKGEPGFSGRPGLPVRIFLKEPRSNKYLFRGDWGLQDSLAFLEKNVH